MTKHPLLCLITVLALLNPLALAQESASSGDAEADIKDEVVETKKEIEEAPEVKIPEDLSPKVDAEIKVVEAFSEELKAYNERLRASLTVTTEQLAKDEAEINAAAQRMPVTSTEEQLQGYEQATQIWRTLVDQVLNLLDAKIEDPPPLPLKNEDLLTLGGEQLRNKLQAAYHGLEKIRTESLELQQKVQEERKNRVYEVLLKAGKVRAGYYNLLMASSGTDSIQFDEAYLSDLVREVKVVPYRILAFAVTKGREFKLKFTSGISGWVSIAEQLLIFLLVFAIPFLLFVFLQRFTNYIDQLRRLIFTSSKMSYKLRTNLAIWISRITPYLPWLLMVMACHIAEGLLLQTDVAEIGAFIPYLRIYLWYRVFRLLAASLFSSISFRGRIESGQKQPDRAQTSARRLGRLIFFELILLHATEDVVRRAIVYSIVSEVIFYLNIVVFAYEFQRWKEEIDGLAERSVSTGLLKVLNRFENRLTKWVLTPLKLLLSLALTAWDQFLEWLGQFDAFKQLSSELLRRKLEDSSSNHRQQLSQSAQLPEDYLKWFDTKAIPEGDLYIQSKRNDFEKYKTLIKRWAEEKVSDDAFVIYGDKGVGKTSLVKKLASDLPELNHLYIDVPAKTSTSQSFYSMLSSHLNCPISSPEGVSECDEGLEKTVIYFDNAQNLFLNRLGGFEAYRCLQELISLQTKNIFWLPIFNQKSWVFLQGVFGKDHLSLHEMQLRSWSDDEIMQLIIKRHDSSSFKMRFDKVIQAVRRGDDDYSEGEELESQFFRLLWGQSRGNPRASIHLWLSALRYYGGKTLTVGIPEFPRSSQFIGASDEMLFIYASLFRHENLSAYELQRVTDLPETSVKKALKIGEDCGALFCDDYFRYSISSQAQYLLSNILEEKNFLYE